MQTNKEQAWSHLTKKEQMALSLVVVSERSKKEASIIMNLSPYKFNEIYTRARKFFIMFSEYYETYNELFPVWTGINAEFTLFMYHIINKRKKPSSLVQEEVFQRFYPTERRNKLWNYVFTNNQPDGHSVGFKNLFLEFDRWNNYRVVPKEFQRPAAFPRRKVRGLKKILESVYATSALGWQLIEQEYTATNPPFTYLPEVTKDNFKVIPVKQSKVNLRYFTENKLPLFRTNEEALNFAELLFDYNNLKKKSSHSARKFWAGFRLRFIKAENYLELMNIKESEEDVMSTKDKKFLESIKDRKVRAPKPSSGEIFWV